MMSDRIEKKVELKAPITRVWQAISDYRKFGEWFLVKLESPFVPGQVSHGQITYPGYEYMVLNMTIQEIKPEYFFSFTWHPYPVDETQDYSNEPQTLVEFKLKEIESGTLLIVTESGFDKLPLERRSEAFKLNEEGWTEQMENIKRYVEKTS